MEKYYLVDLDGTLVFTDFLNNQSYNFALQKNGFDLILNEKRITRQVIFNHYPHISQKILNKIIQEKQDYFLHHITNVDKNIFMFDILAGLGKGKCFLWTAAERIRAESIISEFRLSFLFHDIFFRDKKSIESDISYVCSRLNCEKSEIIVFENDSRIVRNLADNGVSSFLFIQNSTHKI